MEQLRQLLEGIQAVADFNKTLALLSALKSGQISLDELKIIEGGWQLISHEKQIGVPQEDEPDET